MLSVWWSTIIGLRLWLRAPLHNELAITTLFTVTAAAGCNLTCLLVNVLRFQSFSQSILYQHRRIVYVFKAADSIHFMQ